jgi:hypothetical protein
MEEVKLPPQAITAEKNVIGTILLYPESINEVNTILTPEMFYDAKLQSIYKICIAITKKSGSPDLVSVTDEFIKSGNMGDIAYLNELVEPIISSQQIGEYALKIKEKYICRQCITMTNELQNLAFTGDIDAVYEKAKAELTNLSEITSLKGKFFITKNMNDWMKIADQQPIPNMLFSELWHEFELCILFSFTGYGKSTLAMQIAIAISEGYAMPGFKFEAKRQKVLYFDFELSPKQLQGRYSKREGKNYIDTYEFNPNFIRTAIDILNLPTGAKFEDYLIQELEQEIISSGVKIVIIDNLTCVKGDVESAKDAIPFMRRLNILKRTYGLSVLVLAHTPKRNESQPLSLNDLSGSSALSKFCDSCFAIGKSPKDPNIRYLIQLKEKETECLYGRDNVIICHLEQVDNMRMFSFVGYGIETDYLKSVPEEEQKALETAILELHRQGKSLRSIGNQLGRSFSTVKRIIDKRLKDE